MSEAPLWCTPAADKRLEMDKIAMFGRSVVLVLVGCLCRGSSLIRNRNWWEGFWSGISIRGTSLIRNSWVGVPKGVPR